MAEFRVIKFGAILGARLLDAQIVQNDMNDMK